MIEVQNLTKTYRGPVHALRGITLSIKTGLFGLLGPNGAGKTTLMRILATLLRPTTGTARVLGHDVTDSKGQAAIKQSLGYLPQELGLYPELTGAEFLDYVARLKGLPRGVRRQEVNNLIETVGLIEVAQRRVKTYSAGMKRRLGIAQALMGNPHLLIVDEPIAGLDPEERVRLRNLLAELARECLVIMSTHIVEDISLTCPRLAVLHEGRILFDGSPGELIERAQSKVWSIITDGTKPNDGLVVVSSLQVRDGMQYQVIGESVAGYDATPVVPSLEAGYIWLMRGANAGQDFSESA